MALLKWFFAKEAAGPAPSMPSEPRKVAENPSPQAAAPSLRVQTEAPRPEPERRTVMESVGYWEAKDKSGKPIGSGSCWMVGDGLIVTNYHVASIAQDAVAKFPNRGSFPVEGFVAADQPRDIVIGKVHMPSRAVWPLPVREALPAQATDVVVIGSPIGLQNTVTRGIVSAVRHARDLSNFGVSRYRPDDMLVQIDAAINPGNSGGPVLDRQGFVLAMSSFGLSNAQGMNFAIPGRYVTDLMTVLHEPLPLSELPADEAEPEQTEGPADDSDDFGALAETHNLSRIETLHVFRLAVIMVLMDGKIEESETGFMSALADGLGIPLDFALKLFDDTLKLAEREGTGTATEESLKFLKSELHIRQKRLVAALLQDVAKADGKMAKNESAFLRQVSETLRV